MWCRIQITNPLQNNFAQNVQPEYIQAFAFNFQFTEKIEDRGTN